MGERLAQPLLRPGSIEDRAAQRILLALRAATRQASTTRGYSKERSPLKEDDLTIVRASQKLEAMDSIQYCTSFLIGRRQNARVEHVAFIWAGGLGFHCQVAGGVFDMLLQAN